MWNLKNKTIVISGATNGIGRAAAIELIKHGPNLVFTYRNKELADELIAEINNDFPNSCLLYTSPSPRDRTRSRMPSSA